jgi:hypothetical protein
MFKRQPAANHRSMIAAILLLPISDAQCRFLVAQAIFADKDGTNSYPGIKQMQRYVPKCERTIKSYYDWGIDAHYLEEDGRGERTEEDPKGAYKKRYKLHIPGYSEQFHAQNVTSLHRDPEPVEPDLDDPFEGTFDDDISMKETRRMPIAVGQTSYVEEEETQEQVKPAPPRRQALEHIVQLPPQRPEEVTTQQPVEVEEVIQAPDPPPAPAAAPPPAPINVQWQDFARWRILLERRKLTTDMIYLSCKHLKYNYEEFLKYCSMPYNEDWDEAFAHRLAFDPIETWNFTFAKQ